MSWLFIVVAVWMVFLIVVFIFLLRKFTFSKKPDENPHRNETFAMPRGVLRGFLTLTVLVVLIAAQVASVAIAGEDAGTWLRIQEAIDPLAVAFQMIIAFYFGGKIIGQLSDADTERSRNLVPTDHHRGTGEINRDRDAVG